jgi:type IV pilus assembly protein PilW
MMRSHKQSGFSLIELMIAMVLGLVLVGALINTFISSNRTYRVQEGLAQSQESARFALEILGQELRMAGYDLPRGQTYLESKGMADAASITEVLDTCNSEILRVVDHGAIAADRYFYIAPDGQSGINTLYINGQPSVEGIEGIQFTYGESDGDDLNSVISYSDSANVSDWGNVIAVRINLLVAGGEPGFMDQAVNLNRSDDTAEPFEDFDTSDRRMYQVYSTTVALRNAMLDKAE